VRCKQPSNARDFRKVDLKFHSTTTLRTVLNVASSVPSRSEQVSRARNPTKKASSKREGEGLPKNVFCKNDRIYKGVRISMYKSVCILNSTRNEEERLLPFLYLLHPLPSKLVLSVFLQLLHHLPLRRCPLS